jgi:alkanesulfonate monooxygenase SsuD/methylene tetrahydromethanopterin reductase-like flavin-dependent oxidoreductase (luciferase family)
VVAALAHSEASFRFAASSADIVFVTPADLAEVRALTGAAGARPHVFGDLVVFLGRDPGATRARRERLGAFPTDAAVFAGTPAELADLLLDWHAAGLTGFRLRPAALPHDLTEIVDGVVPELQRRGAFRNGYEAGTLRGLLGLERPANRYATRGVR